MSVAYGIIVSVGNKQEKIIEKSLRKCLTLFPNYAIIDVSTNPLVFRKMKRVARHRLEVRMSNITAPQVGSPFTTAVSKVSGIVQEVIANKNGSFRVRLDVAGQPRWTTIN